MRVFIAVELPDGIRTRLNMLIGSLRARLPGPRWVRPEGIHLTLRFLGEVAQPDIAGLAGHLRRLVTGSQPPFEVQVAGLGTFPVSSRPRVLWIGVEPPPPPASGDSLARLAALRLQVEEAVTAACLPRVETDSRPFTPHLTLARWGDARPAPEFRKILDEFGAAECGSFQVSAVALIQSVTAPEGARYHRLEEFPL